MSECRSVSICHSLSWITGWVLPTQSSLTCKILLCSRYTDENTNALRGWVLYCSVSKSWEIRSQTPLTPNSVFLPHWPSIPNLKVLKETFMICAILLLIWALKDPTKCLSRGHLGKITLVYTFASGSFTRLLSDIIKMQFTSLRHDGQLLAVPQLRTQLMQVKGLR